ncbi:sialic acid-binding Ig-like lectin 15 [Heptranchias perlo]|uniref:sialic acid-binding Ig-like lectin 15 n=1 Tax=Heptranchias perlo TaxID=212740 RepID=UPI00355A0B98
MGGLWMLVPLLLSVPGSGSNGVPMTVKVQSRVRGRVGSSVVLPCTFNSSYSHYTTVEITVIWKMEEFFKGPVLFNSTNRAKAHEQFENVVNTNVNGRYGLAGDPREKDASLELKDAALGDNSQYFCRVEVKRPGLPTFMIETKLGTTLEVTGLPAILNLSIQAVNATQFTIVCLVEGEPSPTIMWIDPKNNRLTVNGSNTTVTRGPGKYQIVGELHDPKLGGNYTCVATNDQGSVTHTIYFAVVDEDGLLLKLIISILAGSLVLVILIVIALAIWRRKRGTAKFTPQSTGYKQDSSKYCKVNLDQQQSVVICTAAKPMEVNN